MKILLVDDDKLLTTLMESILQENGHSVEVVSEGREALKRTRDSSIDLVISDWFLKGEIQGLDVIRAFTTAACKAKLAVMTGMPRESLQKQLHEFPKVEMIEKAIDLDGLTEQILGLVPKQ